MFLRRCMPAVSRTLNNFTWCRYVSSKRDSKFLKFQETLDASRESTLPKVQSLFAEKIITSQTEHINKTSDELANLDQKLAELDKMIQQREQAYQTYMDELERDSLVAADENNAPEEVNSDEEEYKQYVEEISLDDKKKTKMDLPRSKVGSLWITGTPDPSVPVTDIPCPGCGAMLQCQKSRMPGFIASEILTTSSHKKLSHTICQRCETMRDYNLALDASMTPDQYHNILKQIKQKRGLVLLVLDVMDFPHSAIFDQLSGIIGHKRPVYIVANKVDLLPQDSIKYLKRAKYMIEEEIFNSMSPEQSSYIRHIALVSAKTGYGMEDLITQLIKQWGMKGDVYVVGATNAGKSTLFNQLIQSDFCKAIARDFLERATTSIWPGTTLNLLKFPVIRPTPDRIRARGKRLSEEALMQKELNHERLHNLSTTGDITYAVLRGHVGYTFLGEKDKLAETTESPTYSEGTYSFKPGSDELKTNFSADSAEVFQKKMFARKLKEMDPSVFAKSSWCYDTPGLVNPNQLINLLTQEELKVLEVKNVSRPRTFILKPSQVIFVSGLGRLDYVQGKTSIYFTVVAQNGLPIFVMDSSEAEDFYNEHVGTPKLGVPLREKEAMDGLPALVSKDFDLHGRGWYEAAGDITLSSLGWCSITAGTGLEVKVRAYTPGGIGCSLRDPSLLPYAVNLRWHRKGRNPFYKVRPSNIIWNEKLGKLTRIPDPLQVQKNKSGKGALRMQQQDEYAMTGGTNDL